VEKELQSLSNCVKNLPNLIRATIRQVVLCLGYVNNSIKTENGSHRGH